MNHNLGSGFVFMERAEATRDGEPPPCVGCKNHTEFGHGTQAIHLCRVASEYDPVHGRRALVRNCYDMRSEDGLCSPAALLHEPRVPTRAERIWHRWQAFTARLG